MRFCPNTSSVFLNAIETIQNSVATAMNERISPITYQTSWVGRTIARSIFLSAFPASVISEAPAARQHEHQHRQPHQKDDEHGRHRRGVAILVEEKRLLIYVENRERCRVRRTAARHHIDEIEGLRTAYGRHGRDEQHEKAGGTQQRQRDFEERLDGVCA